MNLNNAFLAGIVIPETVNGPLDVGLSAAASDRADRTAILHIYPTIGDTMSRIPEVAGLPASALRTYRICTALILIKRWYLHGNDIDANVLVHDVRPAAAPGPNSFTITSAWLADVTQSEINTCTLLCMCGKVTFWQVNHHTGQGEVVGFSLKVMQLALTITGQPSREIVRFVWMLGHWVSTMSTWKSFGVTDIVDPTDGVFDRANWPTPTRDITMRMAAGPAGTGKVTICQKIVDVGAKSVFSMVLNPDGAYQALATLPTVHLSARNHEGALHFTGLPKLELLAIEEGTLASLAAFVHAVLPRSSLSKSKVLPSRDSVAGDDTYVRLISMVASLKTVATDARTVARMRIMLGVGATGDPFAGVHAALGITARIIPDEATVTAALALAAPGGAAGVTVGGAGNVTAPSGVVSLATAILPAGPSLA